MDPNRMSTFPLSNESVCRRVKAIAQTKMTSNWTWGKEPYTREDPPPSVSIQSNSADPNDFLRSEAYFNFSFVSQRDIPRRATEDDDCPPSKSGVDWTVADEEDFYPEADLPKANIVRRGKASIASCYRNAWDTDTSDDECQLLITLDAVPLNASCPDPEAPPAAGTRRARSEAPPAEDPEASDRGRKGERYKRSARKTPGGAPPAKKQKKAAGRSKPKRPTYDG